MNSYRPVVCARRSLLVLALGALPLVPCGQAREQAAVVRCANLIYGGNHTSRCFSDEFLGAVQRETGIATERRFKAVKLDSDEVFQYPFAMMTGESDFNFTIREREHLQRYLTRGGFLLASAGCSNSAWDTAFRREMRTLFPDAALVRLPMDHALFRTVYTIEKLTTTSPGHEPYLEGLDLDGRLAVVYSSHGLNDTNNTEGCCCCGGNEIANSLQVNVNVLSYALVH